MDRTDGRRRTLALRLSLTLTLSVGVLWLGGATQRGLLCVAVLAVLSGLLVLWGERVRLGKRARVVLGTLVAMTTLALLQLVPLPAVVLRHLSPHGAALWSAADALLGRVDAWHPVSLDPAATSFSACTLAATAVVFWTSAAMVKTGDADGVLESVAIAAAVFCLVTIAHSVVGARAVYGLYVPAATLTDAPPIVTPLLNPNHAAAVAGIGFAACVGVGSSADATVGKRVLAYLFAALAVGITLATLSRSGIVVVVAEAVAFAAYFVTAAWRRGRVKSVVPYVGVAAASVAVMFFVARIAIAHEWRTMNVGKARLVGDSLDAIRDFARIGVGQGAYSAVSGMYARSLELASDPVVRRLSHVESWPADLAVGLGVPAALAIVVVLSFVAARSARRALRRPATFAAAIGVAGLVAHDLADFSLEFIGVGALAAALAAVAVVERSTGASTSHGGSVKAVRWLPAVLVFPAAALVISTWGHLVEKDLQRIGTSYTNPAAKEVDATLDAAIAAHPGESFFVLAKGIRSIRSSEGGALLRRAVLLAPTRPQPHFWLARWLVLFGLKAQAWAEYREVVRLAPGMLDVVFVDMARFGAEPDEFVAASPDGSFLEHAAPALTRAGRDGDVAIVDDVLIDRFPPALAARARRIRREHAAGHDVAPLVADLETVGKSWAPAYLVAAEVASTPEGAEDALRLGLSALPDDPVLLETLVRRKGARLGLDSVTAELSKLHDACEKKGCIARYHGVQGDVEAARARYAQALHHYVTAAEASPDGLEWRDQVALMAEKLSMWDLAVDNWSRLVGAYPDRADYAEGLRRALNQGAHP